jgi:hypothetical protein
VPNLKICATERQVFSSKHNSCFSILTYWKLSFINVSSRRGEKKFFTQRKFCRCFLIYASTKFIEKNFKTHFVPYSKHPTISITKTTILIEHREIIAVSCKKNDTRNIFLNMPVECDVRNASAVNTLSNHCSLTF